MKNLITSIAILLIIFSSLFLSGCTSSNVERPVEGYAAPTFSLLDGEGKRHNLKDYLGKVVLLEFWASYWAPCIEGGAFFSTIYQEYKGLGLEVIGINLDNPATAKAINDLEEFKKSRGINFTTLYDRDLKVAQKYNIKGIPVTYLIDSEGIIRKIWIGFRIQWSQEFRKEIEKYLKTITTE